MFITSQVLIVVAALIDILSRTSKSKKYILFFAIFACCTYASSYIFLQSWAAVIGFFAAALRSLVYYYVDKKPTKTKKIVSCVSLMLFTITLILVFWSGAKDILMLLPAIVLIAVFTQNNIIFIRSALILASICNLIYDIIIGSYMAIVIDIILITSTFFALIYLDIFKKIKNKNNINQVK